MPAAAAVFVLFFPSALVLFVPLAVGPTEA